MHVPINRRKARILALLLSGSISLSACQFNPSPSPDPALVSLAYQAHVDAATDSLRAQQSDELFAEIARLCGHTRDGEYPSACSKDTILSGSIDAPAPISTDAHALYDQAADALILQASAIPASSRGLIARQYGQLITQGARTSDIDTTATLNNIHDINDLKAALEWEYSIIAGLSIASSYTAADVNSIADMHRDIAHTLIDILRNNNIDIPVASPAYTFSDIQVIDQATATAFINRVQQDTEDLWYGYAENAQSTPWFKTCLWVIGLLNTIQG